MSSLGNHLWADAPVRVSKEIAQWRAIRARCASSVSILERKSS